MGSVCVKNLTLGYERRPAVHHLDGDFPAATLSAIVGPNGSGKSTLLKGLAGALRPLAGHIDLGDLHPGEIAYLPQESGVAKTFPMTLEALVSLGLWKQRGLFGAIRKADRARIADAFAAVGLTGLETRAVDQVSGGQLQRALFARVLLQDAKLILLDEPFAALDARTTTDLLDLIRRWPGEGRTVIMVLHDLDMVRAVCPHTLLMAREAVAWGATKDVLAPEPLLAARRLSEAWTSHADVCRYDAHGHSHDHDHDHGHDGGLAA
jgi:zinc/manganese transport system ATP-binding protein